jgi:hypothetical protein
MLGTKETIIACHVKNSVDRVLFVICYHIIHTSLNGGGYDASPVSSSRG